MNKKREAEVKKCLDAMSAAAAGFEIAAVNLASLSFFLSTLVDIADTKDDARVGLTLFTQDAFNQLDEIWNKRRGTTLQ